MSPVSNGIVNQVYIGLGSNLGDRIQQLIDAKNQLEALKNTRVLRSSSLYESSPVGYAKQNNFINCVVELEFSADQNILFTAMQMIENNIGRVRDANNQNAPRSIDLDLLLFASIQSDNPELTIPHPRINRRLFVLLPLHELQPQLQIPDLGTVNEIIQTGKNNNYFDGQSVRKLIGNELEDWVS